ncbi:type II toxin-antitoxin system TacA family antitoxin [Pseudomonas sp. EL_65y_Pfl2_R95]|uniref:type II toxin-antitoxin system TacA family antitoxin n=1 Tax=Pseudomonas sp. EL_65y_Pfl2_R95 TaxID=3088698 RepID=UPI0030D7ED37
MATTVEREKPVPINMRVDTKKRSLIDAAVELLGTDRTSFILDAACQRAEEIIRDRQLYILSDDAFDRFEQALEADPVTANKCLQKLMSKPTRWS